MNVRASSGPTEKLFKTCRNQIAENEVHENQTEVLQSLPQVVETKLIQSLPQSQTTMVMLVNNDPVAPHELEQFSEDSMDEESDIQGEIVNSDEEELTTVQLSPQNAIVGKLPDDKELILLIDSGSTVSIISSQTMHACKYISALHKNYFSEPLKLQVANGEYITAKSYLFIPVYIQKQEIVLKVIVTDQSFGTIDIIIGTEDLSKYSAILDFERHKLIFRVKQYNRCLRLQHDAYIKPFSHKYLTIAGKVPKIMKNRSVVVVPVGAAKYYMPSSLMVDMRANTCQVLLLNNSHKKVYLKAGQKIARIDLAGCCSVYNPVVGIEVNPLQTIMYVDSCGIERVQDNDHEIDDQPSSVSPDMSDNKELLEPQKVISQGEIEVELDRKIQNIGMTDVRDKDSEDDQFTDIETNFEGTDIDLDVPKYRNQVLILDDEQDDLAIPDQGDNPGDLDARLIDREKVKEENKRQYPFLQEEDIRCGKLPSEIMKEEIDLVTDSLLPTDQHHQFLALLMKYREAFSLYGEIGDSKHEVKLQLTSTEPKYIRPYYASQEDKKIIDKEMERLEQLGVIKEGLATFSSPVMLIAKRDASAKKRVVLDLRLINQRIRKLQFAFPLVEDCLEVIGMQQSAVLSCLDIRDAFFSIRLAKESQPWCGISTYAGSAKSYYFVRLAMGLSISPSVFSEYIQKILAEIPGSENFVVSYMDDLLIHSKSISEHIGHIESILQALIRAGLRISPKKSLFFRSKVDYLGHTIQIVDGKPHMSVQHSKIRAIVRLKPPNNVARVRGFCGAVNYLSRFLPELSTLLLPIRKLTRKDSKCEWTEECQENFEKN